MKEFFTYENPSEINIIEISFMNIALESSDLKELVERIS